MNTAWTVRAGREGEREAAALQEGLIIAGWDELGDLSGYSSRPDLRKEIERTYPEASRAVIGNWTGQLWRLIHEMSTGDLVALPRKQQIIAIGRIEGGYRFRDDAVPGFQHVRPVTWLRTDLPRAAVQQDLLDSMGSLLTIFQLRRFGAASRIAELAESGRDPGPPGGSSTEADSIEALAVEVAKQGGSLSISVRELLKCAGFLRRTSDSIFQIEVDLIESGLTTRPPFTDGGIDSRIDVVTVGEEPDDAAAQESGAARDSEQVLASPFMLRVDRLKTATSGVESVRPNEALEVAQTKMIANNYSQLAVIDENGALHGAIGWESIGLAKIAGPARLVQSAIGVAHPVNYDEDLLSRIDEIYRNGYVFVRGEDQTIVGIVTAADLTLEFGELILPLVLIEEAERRLRRRVSEVFTSEQIATLTNKRAKSAARLTFGSYAYVLAKADDWKRLDWSLDHQIFLNYLSDACSIRNSFMHFNPDEFAGLSVERLSGFVRLLRAVDTEE